VITCYLCNNSNMSELMYTMGGRVVCTKCFPEVRNPHLVKDTKVIMLDLSSLHKFANYLEAKHNGC